MHDAVNLEAAGTPAAVIVTTVFEHESHVQRDALGMEDLAPVIITHPLSTLTDEQIRERALEAVPQVKAVWTGA